MFLKMQLYLTQIVFLFFRGQKGVLYRESSRAYPLTTGLRPCTLSLCMENPLFMHPLNLGQPHFSQAK